MPAEEQINAAVKTLQYLNPGYIGKETHKVENGIVTQLQLLTDHVSDISPVQALSGLCWLIYGSGNGHAGKRSDVSQLKIHPG